MSKSVIVHEFSEEYKEICKQAWYTAGRPSDRIFLQEALPVDRATGQKPLPTTIAKWRRDYWWDTWADELDSKALAVVEDELVTKKIEMLKRQADIGASLQTLGMKYLEDNDFDSASAAVNAVIRGAELERSSRGLGEFALKVAKLDNTGLVDEIKKYLDRASENNQFVGAVDADVVPTEKEETDTED